MDIFHVQTTNRGLAANSPEMSTLATFYPHPSRSTISTVGLHSIAVITLQGTHKLWTSLICWQGLRGKSFACIIFFVQLFKHAQKTRLFVNDLYLGKKMSRHTGFALFETQVLVRFVCVCDLVALRHCKLEEFVVVFGVLFGASSLVLILVNQAS